MQLDEVVQLQLGRAEIINFENGQEVTPRQWLKDPKESIKVLHEFKPFIGWMLQIVQEDGIRTVHCYREDRYEEIDPVRTGVMNPITQGYIIYPYASINTLFGELPRDLSNESPVLMQFSPFPHHLHIVLRDLALSVVRGELDSEKAVNSLYEIVESDPRRWLTLQDDFAPPPKLWVRALGRKDGRWAQYSYWFTRPMWNVGGYFLTSVALVVAVYKILRGEIEKRGVMTAEKTFDPIPFLDEVESLIAESIKDGKMLGETFDWLE